jgi:hypothetical protein
MAPAKGIPVNPKSVKSAIARTSSDAGVERHAEQSGESAVRVSNTSDPLRVDEIESLKVIDTPAEIPDHFG